MLTTLADMKTLSGPYTYEHDGLFKPHDNTFGYNKEHKGFNLPTPFIINIINIKDIVGSGIYETNVLPSLSL